ncbi:SH3 domain-containing protein [Novosphingobium sp.]|uniref:SH3 domain-containing protein n=1 Tax=Novosphingobium sp. TaxID=1874826 RepID=UPI0025F9B751|nr:SH3 domain-containing protein [Novosphingobium sp.]
MKQAGRPAGQQPGTVHAKRWLRVVVAALVALMSVEPLHAAADEYPHWGSIKADHANMHVGPGFDYRVKYIYQRKGLPVKVLRAMGGWWLVEDPDGARGWVLQRLVGHGRTGMVKDDMAEVREKNDGGGRLLWRARAGVIGKLDKCSSDWCRFTIQTLQGDTRQGWVNRKAVWGAVEF